MNLSWQLWLYLAAALDNVCIGSGTRQGERIRALDVNLRKPTVLISAHSSLEPMMTDRAMRDATRLSVLRGGLTAHSVAALLLRALIWGLSIPATKLGLLTLPPLTLTALRYLVAVPLLMIFALGRLRVAWRALPSIAALGVLGISLGQVAQAFGVEGTSASAGTIISATIPVFVVIFATLRLKQPVTGRQQLGLLAAFAGIAVIASGSGSGPTDASKTTVIGVIWLLGSALAIAFYYVWSAQLTAALGTMAVAAWSTLFGFIHSCPLLVGRCRTRPFSSRLKPFGLPFILASWCLSRACSCGCICCARFRPVSQRVSSISSLFSALPLRQPCLATGWARCLPPASS